MLKSKTMFGFIALVMVLALAQSGYAQLSISATGNPSPRETATNHTAETNDPTVGNGMIITGALLSDAQVTGGRLRITYPARVTNTATVNGAATGQPAGTMVGFPATDPIQITSATGIFAGATIGAVSNVNGRVDINLPCGTPATIGATGGHVGGAVTTGTIILTGVRIDANAIGTAPASAAFSIVSAPATASSSPLAAGGSSSRDASCNATGAIDPVTFRLQLQLSR